MTQPAGEPVIPLWLHFYWRGYGIHRTLWVTSQRSAIHSKVLHTASSSCLCSSSLSSQWKYCPALTISCIHGCLIPPPTLSQPTFTPAMRWSAGLYPFYRQETSLRKMTTQTFPLFFLEPPNVLLPFPTTAL